MAHFGIVQLGRNEHWSDAALDQTLGKLPEVLFAGAPENWAPVQQKEDAGWLSHETGLVQALGELVSFCRLA